MEIFNKPQINISTKNGQILKNKKGFNKYYFHQFLIAERLSVFKII